MIIWCNIFFRLDWIWRTQKNMFWAPFWWRNSRALFSRVWGRIPETASFGRWRKSWWKGCHHTQQGVRERHEQFWIPPTLLSLFERWMRVHSSETQVQKQEVWYPWFGPSHLVSGQKCKSWSQACSRHVTKGTLLFNNTKLLFLLGISEN